MTDLTDLCKRIYDVSPGYRDDADWSPAVAVLREALTEGVDPDDVYTVRRRILFEEVDFATKYVEDAFDRILAAKGADKPGAVAEVERLRKLVDAEVGLRRLAGEDKAAAWAEIKRLRGILGYLQYAKFAAKPSVEPSGSAEEAARETAREVDNAHKGPGGENAVSDKPMTAWDVLMDIKGYVIFTDRPVVVDPLPNDRAEKLIEAYAAWCVKEARERLVSEIKGLAKRIDFEYVLNFNDIDAAVEATK